MSRKPAGDNVQSRDQLLERASRLTVLLLCGGRATRLRPLSSPDQPKSMVPYLGRPLVDYLLDLMADNGLSDVVLSSGHESFVSHLSRSAYCETMRIRYNEPQGPWRGTASCALEVVSALGKDVSDPYLVVYGDSLLHADLAAMAAFHLSRKADATILYHRPDFGAFLYEPVDEPPPDRPRTNYGVMDCNPDGLVTRFVEKPYVDEIGELFRDPCANAAAYVVARDALERVGQSALGDFACHVFPAMVEGGMSVLGFGIGTGYREDVGTLDRYLRLHMLALEGEIDIPHLRSASASRVWIGDDATVSPDATLVPPVVVGRRSVVAPGARLERCYLGEDVQVGDGAIISSSVVHSNASIGAGAHIRCSVLASHATVETEVGLPAGTVVGPYAVFGDRRLSSLGGGYGQART